MVCELVLTRNQLLQILRSQKDSEFAAPLQRLNHVTSELQEGVMKTRMQPIGNAWAKLPRLVRDLAHELGKKIDLQMLGADTELDRQVLELIKDPLTHMVRNSADHGLETPVERLRSGKTETGRVTLNAYHEGGHIIIEIADDGRGLNIDRIKQKALQNGLATEAELAAMSDSQIQRFILQPGFSTAAKVTSVSGRGVGMDVVKTNIEKIGGTIEMKSTLRPWLDLHHQDPADPGDRFGPDRRVRHRAVRHPADQRRRAGPRRRRQRAHDRADQRHAGPAPAQPAAAAGIAAEAAAARRSGP